MSIHLSVPSLPNQNEHGEQWRFFMVSRLEKRNATIPEHCTPPNHRSPSAPVVGGC